MAIMRRSISPTRRRCGCDECRDVASLLLELDGGNDDGIKPARSLYREQKVGAVAAATTLTQ
jgi:hypothetical protein